MESLLGFKDTTENDVVSDRSCGYKLVPWITWDEWNFVRDSLFSSTPHSVASALSRILAWRSRGCVPVVVEVTASIIEIQQKDPFFRDDLTDNSLHSEEMLAMLYCMAIVRLVNGVVEKTRKKTEVSIAEAAGAIGIPRMLIDIRHDGSHRDLPSLRLVRLASIKAIDWLKSYYWEPQKKAIPFQSDGTSNLRKEIKSRLRELALSLKLKQTTSSNTSHVKGKRFKHRENLYGHNKFLSFIAGKTPSSKSSGPKKKITNALKNLLRLYSSFSSEVVTVLLEFLLKALDSSNLEELPKSSQTCHSTINLQTVFDDWKPVILKLSTKEPELLVSLLKAVLERLQTQEAMKYEIGEQQSSECSAEFHQIKQLSYLFEWLVGNLKGLKPVCRKASAADTYGSTKLNMPKAILVEFLRKCLLLSSPGNNQLLASAMVFGHMMGNSSLVEKLNKLSLLSLSNPGINEDDYSIVSYESFLSQQEDSIRQVAEKLELINLRRMKNNVNTTDGEKGNKSRWVVTKSWNSCPIGTLPRVLGSCGYLPVLNCNNDHKSVVDLSESKDHCERNDCSGKREADCAIELLDNSSVKKMRESEEGSESNGNEDTSSEGIKGQLMIGGVWKKVSEEELFAIASSVRILV